MKRLLRWIIRLTVAGLVAGSLIVLITYLIIAPDLPDVETLRDVHLQVPLRVYTADRRLIEVYGERRRIPAQLEEMPDHLVNAFIAGEDARFYEHPGVDYQGLTRAVITLITTGEKTVGGSTITQMLARNFFLSLEKTYSRKIREIFLALRIERELSKQEILELFLNKILLGHRAYGVGAAAEVYYGKSLDELNLAQCAMIASLAKAPSRINPITSPERALERRNYVLSRMQELGYIGDAEYRDAVAKRDNASYHGATTEVSAPHLAEMVRQEALRRLGEDAYTGGFEIVTTLDSRLQTAANLAVHNGLEAYDRRHGYRGAEAHVELTDESTTAEYEEALSPFGSVAGLVPGLVIEAEDEMALVYLETGQTAALTLEDVAWARPQISHNAVGTEPQAVTDVIAAGDIIRARLHDDGSWGLAQLPEVEAALVSINPRNGAIVSLIGGYDYRRSKFNRAVQSRRQPGSSFKPFLYSAALANGFTTASVINDAPIVFDDSELERTWKPQNFSEKFFGPTRLREAMVNSRNLVSIRLLRSLGINTAREYISAFGFDPADLPANLSMALGSANLQPLEMARGYAVFANGGYLVEPHFIERIIDMNGQVVHRANPPVICPDCTEPEPLPADATAKPAPTKPLYRPLSISTDSEVIETVAIGDTGEEPAAPTRYAQQVIAPQNAFLVRSIMMDVIQRGTAKRAKELGRSDLAGKTGTTNDQHDAWFSGFNDQIVTTVWVGFDDHEPLGRYEVGGRAALPIWIEFMRVALEGLPDEPPAMPEGLATARIDPETGLLAALDNPDAIMELFEAGNLPRLEQAAKEADPNAAPEEDPYDLF